MEVKNFMEEMVWQRVDEIIAMHRDACKCQRCRYDIVALALNALPPRYVVTLKGEVYSRTHTMEQQFNADILTAVSEAIVRVNQAPNHEEDVVIKPDNPEEA